MNLNDGKSTHKRRERSSSSDSCSNDGKKDIKLNNRKTKLLQKKRNTSKHKYKRMRTKTSSSDSSTSEDSSTSSSDSSSSSSSEEERKRKKKSNLQKKLKKRNKRKNQTYGPEKKPKEESPSNDIPLELMGQRSAMAPMTKEEWEKKQSVVKRQYDPTTGRHRLIKGDGEVIEEIVSRDRHKQINQQATKGDGEFFQNQLKKK